jgi:hypothetical protein
MAVRGLFADQPLSVSKLPAFRAEHFPYSGPYPWLDRPDALDRVEEKLRQGQIDAADAEQCRYWTENGYVILPRLFAGSVLDEVWEANEKAIRTGKIVLPTEPVSQDDPYPGRCLNPHKKIAAFCQILKHPGLLHWIRASRGAGAQDAADYYISQRYTAGPALGFDSYDDLPAGLSDSGLGRIRRYSSG